jgi:hypothetical protein
MNWFIQQFGTSDVLENPDASTLAARAAGHWAIGAASQMFAIGAGLPSWAGHAALILLYGAFELWQRQRDPARHQRRVARRWDIVVDWSSVQLGGLCAGLSAAAAGWPVLGAVIASGVLILGSAALMARGRADV